MKELGYEIDKRQVTQMMEYLDESGKGIITKEVFLKFMTARLVRDGLGRISGTSRSN
jgi:Ca2+-binding EF-hand superfamily protein